MNWIQQNKTLAGILGCMIAGAVGIGVWFYLSYSDYSAAMEQWNGLSGTVNTLHAANPYPTAENVKAKQKDINDYREKFTTLRKVLLSPNLQQPIKPMTETEFQAKVKERAVAVKKKADAVRMTLPSSDFALGFEAYASDVPPNATLAAELNVHLDVMEKLINVFIEKGVTKLDSIRRTTLPGEKSSGKNDQAASSSSSVTIGSKPTAAEEAAQRVLERYTITCFFTSDQEPLRNVLNELSNPATMPHFLAVRLMRVENEKSEGASKEEVRNLLKSMPAAAPAESPAKPGTPSAGAGESTSPLPPDAVTIMGGEELKVYLEIDYIRFRDPAGEPAAGDDGKPK